MSMPNEKKIRLQEELEHRILHGLACEWEAALWVLSPRDRDRMRKPLFSLRAMKNRLGYWSGEKYEICLSRDLVLNHPWDAVREVLRHEIAHQFTEVFWGVTDEPPHGPYFQKACYLLRANPKASGQYATLHERLLEKSEDKIIRRIQKLMALAESQNRHEAEAAMAKGHELLLKYNIDLLSLNETRNFQSVFVGQPALRHFREAYHLAHLLQDFYFVDGLWVSAYVIKKSKMGRVLEISGTRQNVKIAGYVHDFVNQHIDVQWHKYNQQKRLNRYRKTDFAVGIIEGFRTKIERQAQKPADHPAPYALVKFEDPLLKEYIAYKYPHITRFRRQVANQDEKVLEDGIRIGRKLIISQGITEKRSGKRRFIENKRI